MIGAEDRWEPILPCHFGWKLLVMIILNFDIFCEDPLDGKF